MRAYSWICIILSIIFSENLLVAQSLSFRNLTEENVFDRQPVLSIAQDQQGKLWFAGENGIYSYDSRNISNLMQYDTAVSVLGYITKIAVNKRNHLLIATYKNLYIYDLNKRKLWQENRETFAKDIVVLDMQIIDGQTYLCTTDGLYSLELANNRYNLKLIIRRKQTQAISKIEQHQFALASEQGIELLQLSNGHISQISNIQLPISTAAERIIPHIYAEKGKLWISSRFHGVFLYDLTQKKWSNYTTQNSNLLSNNVRKITRDPNGQLLIGTLKGLSIQQHDGSFQNHKHNTSTGASLSQNSIYDIFVDKQKITWIGTYFGGLNARYPDLIKLTTHSTRSNTAHHRLSSDIISSIAESKDAYWIGTEEEGVTRLDKQTLNSTVLPNITASNLVKDIDVRNEKLYIAQYAGGYTVIDIATQKTTNHQLHDNPHHISNNIYSIYVDTQETIYLGTNAGLYMVKKNLPPKLIPEISGVVVNDVQENQGETIYVLANNRLYAKEKNAPTFQVLTPDKQSIHGFSIDKQDNLWFTTEESVYMKTSTGELRQIARFTGNKLGSPLAVANKLWITSRNGLVFYDLNSKYSNVLTQQDGLPVKNLQTAKLFLSQNNRFFISTLNGLVSFHTKDISFNNIAPTVILNRIAIEDNELPFEQLIPKDQPNSYKLRLAHDQNFLSLDFSSNNFIKPEKNRFRYKLENVDKGWIEVSTPHIRYTNIPEGKHTLYIYASNNDRIWSTNPLKIEITVLPAFWNTWWAYLIYAILFAVAIHFVIKFIVERKMLLNAEKEHERKITFFTQISHEIRTPLTLITAPLDDIILETADQSRTQQKVKRIKKNANKLLSVINELLDFKKFDDRKMQLKKTPVNLREYIEDCFYLLSDLAHSKNINYYIRTLDAVGIIQIDTQQFDKVLFNLLSNAIKYTPSAGTVCLDLMDEGDTIAIRIADNGVGVSETNQFKIFEEYYREQQTENTIGTGIGLALAKIIVEQHEGNIQCSTINDQGQQWTVFTVHLKKEMNNPSVSAVSDYTTIPETLPLVNPKLAASTEILLIVEDNSEVLEHIVNLFHDHYSIVTAHDGEEGLHKAQQYLPDVIISDIMMPKMNGTEFCQAVKTDMTTSHIPFILLTAITDRATEIKHLEYGANIYLTKPFDNAQLYFSVTNLIQISKRNREAFTLNKPTKTNEGDLLFMKTLDQLIEDHLTDDGFDVNFISRQMGMSAPILYRKLKAITDLSINNYVKIYRLTKAKELLQTHLNISEVAWAVGFSDRKYFSKEFKKHFGANPSDFITKDS